MYPDPDPAPSRLPARDDPPDPLDPPDTEPVTTPAGWRERRGVVKRLFRRYVYGFAPDPVPVEATTERREAFGGAATLTEATLSLPGGTVDLALFTPADAEAAPTFLALNREGTHATTADPAVSVTESGRERGGDRGERAAFWCVERVVDRGYGVATFHQADVATDEDGVDGVRAAFGPGDLPGPPEAAWGTLAAWAWGLGRCVDYLREEPLVGDIAVTGHSRRGKAALLAGATDERVDLVVPHQSGTGGTALSRHNGQESVTDIVSTFPHWFADSFAAFAGRPERLPVDQHLLAALVAPRPLLDTQGARDYWANPGLALDALGAAAPVYELLGAAYGGLSHGSTTPTGDLAQHRRETGHTLGWTHWEAVLAFADRHLEAGG